MLPRRFRTAGFDDMPSRVVFHHVNKCAGTTLLEFLEGTTPPERVAAIEQLVAMPDPAGAERMAALLRAGLVHDPFGLHDWKGLFGDVVDVIFLRDPVERLWSEWRMIARWDDPLVAARGEPYRRLRDVARTGFIPFLSLPGAAAFGNAFACHLSRGGPELDDVLAASAAAAAPPAALVATLDARLAAIDVVGFVETFAASFHELVAAVGWPAPPRLQDHNVHPAAAPLAASERALAEACTRLDRPLVEAARARSAARQTAPLADLRDQAAARGRARVLEPPESLILDMGDGFVGTGWHPPEVNGRRRTRWIGPGPTATLELRIDRRRPLALRLRVGNHLRAAQVDGLRILADGLPCAVDHWVLPPFDHFFEATIPAAPDGPPLLRLAVDCGQTAPAADPADTRSLGVEIGEIELAPAGRFMPRSLAGLARVRGELAALAALADGNRRTWHLLDSLPPA